MFLIHRGYECVFNVRVVDISDTTIVGALLFSPATNKQIIPTTRFDENDTVEFTISSTVTANAPIGNYSLTVYQVVNKQPQVIAYFENFARCISAPPTDAESVADNGEVSIVLPSTQEPVAQTSDLTDEDVINYINTIS